MLEVLEILFVFPDCKGHTGEGPYSKGEHDYFIIRADCTWYLLHVEFEIFLITCYYFCFYSILEDLQLLDAMPLCMGLD